MQSKKVCFYLPQSTGSPGLCLVSLPHLCTGCHGHSYPQGQIYSPSLVHHDTHPGTCEVAHGLHLIITNIQLWPHLPRNPCKICILLPSYVSSQMSVNLNLNLNIPPGQRSLNRGCCLVPSGWSLNLTFSGQLSFGSLPIWNHLGLGCHVAVHFSESCWTRELRVKTGGQVISIMLTCRKRWRWVWASHSTETWILYVHIPIIV